MARGAELDNIIENELQAMLDEGLDKSPISPKLLHDRLVAKGVIKGGLSTLSLPNRKKLIQNYTAEQIKPLNMADKENQLYINGRTRDALKSKNTRLKEKVAELESKLEQNSSTLVEIIKQVKLKTDIEIDTFLAQHLIYELKQKSELKVLK